jgi:hypothetical protein
MTIYELSKASHMTITWYPDPKELTTNMSSDFPCRKIVSMTLRNFNKRCTYVNYKMAKMVIKHNKKEKKKKLPYIQAGFSVNENIFLFHNNNFKVHLFAYAEYN